MIAVVAPTAASIVVPATAAAAGASPVVSPPAPAGPPKIPTAKPVVAPSVAHPAVATGRPKARAAAATSAVAPQPSRERKPITAEPTAIAALPLGTANGGAAPTATASCAGCSTGTASSRGAEGVSSTVSGPTSITNRLLTVNGLPLGSDGRVAPGDVLTYEVGVTNNSRTPAITSLRQPLPAHTGYVGDSQQGWSFSDGVAVTTVSVPAGQTSVRLLTVKVDPVLAAGTTELTNPGPCPTCSVVTPVVAVEVVKTASATSAAPGGRVIYTISVRNIDSSQPLEIVDELAGLLDDADYNDDATAPPGRSGTRLTWAFDLARGQERTVTYSVTIAASRGGDGRLTGSVTSRGSNCDGSALSATRAACAPEPVALQRYTATLSSSATAVRPGGQVTYTLTVGNSGAVAFSPSDPAEVSVDLSGVVDDADYRGDATGATTRVGDVLTWRTELATGQVRTFTYTATARNPASGDQVMLSRLRTAPSGNCAVSSAPAGCSAAPVTVRLATLNKSASTAATRTGQVVTFSIAVANPGRQDYTASDPLRVDDDLTDVLDDAALLPGPAVPSPNGGRLSWSLALTAGASATLSYSVHVIDSPTGNHRLVGRAIIADAAGGECPSGVGAGRDCAAVAVPVQSFVLTKSASASVARPGTVVTTVITVQNTGAIDFDGDSLSFSEDLSGVLDDAELVGADGAQRAGSVLRWRIPAALPVGSSAAVSYTVRVLDQVVGDHRISSQLDAAADSGGTCGAERRSPRCAPWTIDVQSFAVSISADVARVAVAGSVVTYTVTIHNDGAADYSPTVPARASVDLSGVLDDAAYRDDAGGGPERNGNELSWRLPLAAGATMRYTFSVALPDPVAGDHRLAVVVRTPAGLGGNCAGQRTDATCRPPAVLVKAFTVTKVSSRQAVVPGGVVTYTITVHNTGAVDYPATDPVRFSDDLSRLLDDATYNRDATGPVAYSGSVLSWAVPLAQGASTAVTYSVTVRPPGSGDGVLLNSVQTPVGSGGNCPAGSTAPACQPPPAGSLSLSITHAADRSGAVAGDRVYVTITVRNTGAMPYSAHRASFTDDLSQVLDDAHYNGDATASAGLVEYAAPALTWSGDLDVAATVTVRFSVTVNSSDDGDAQLVGTVRTPGGLGASCRDLATAPTGELRPPPTDASGPGCPVIVAVARLSLEYTAATSTVERVGEQLVLRYLVVNSGRLALTDLAVNHFAFTGGGAPPDATICTTQIGSLLPGARATCNVIYTVTQSDIDQRMLADTALVRAVGPDGLVVSSNESTVLLTGPPALSLTLASRVIDINGDGQIDSGDQIDWVITVANAGPGPVLDLTVLDSLGHGYPCELAFLDAGAQTRCGGAAYRIGEPRSNRPVINQAMAIGNDDQGRPLVSNAVQSGISIPVSRANPDAGVSAAPGTSVTAILSSTVVAVMLLGALAGLRLTPRRRR